MGRLEVRVCEARDLLRPADTYVKAKVEKKSHKTSTVRHSVTPRFDQVFLFHVEDPATAKLQLELCEVGILTDSVVGKYSLKVSLLYRDQPTDEWLVLRGNTRAKGALHVRLTALDFGLRTASPAVSPQRQPSLRYLPSLPQGSTGNSEASTPGASPAAPPAPLSPSLVGASGAYSQGTSAHASPGHYPPLTQQGPVVSPGGHLQPGFDSGHVSPQQFAFAYSPQQHGHGSPQAAGHGGSPQMLHFSYAYPPPFAFFPGAPMPPMAVPVDPSSPPRTFAYAPPPRMEPNRAGVMPSPRVPVSAPPWEKMGVTQVEYDHLVAVFYKFAQDDGDSDNPRLTRAELAALARWLNYATSENAISRMFRDMNKSGDDTVSREDFCAWVAHNRPDPQYLYGLSQMEYNHVLAQFRQCDTAKSGFIRREEFTAFASMNGWAGSDADAAALFDRVDQSHRNAISLHDFLVFRSTHGRHLAIETVQGRKHTPPPTPQQRAANAAAAAPSPTPTPAVATPGVSPPPSAAQSPDRQPHEHHHRRHHRHHGHSRSASNGAATGDNNNVAPDPAQAAVVERVCAVVPQLTAAEAASLLRRVDWDAHRAVVAALDGARA